MSDEQQQFFFDEFFADESDAGVVVPVTIRGKQVPITFKRGLTVEDKSRAQQAAVQKRLTADGRLVYDGVDESKAVELMLLAAIKDWPFTYRDGRKVPVSVENIRNLLGGADEMADIIQKLDAEGAEALVPFVSPSAEV